MTAWTWMRYSYCWTMGSRELGDLMTGYGKVWPTDAYVEIAARLEDREFRPDETGEWHVLATSHLDRSMEVDVIGSQRPPAACADGLRRLRGRVCGREVTDTWHEGSNSIDTTASRFTGGSIAGLVVGAMGVFIFGLYLRAWLRERRG
jgi:hypothetical protein